MWFTYGMAVVTLLLDQLIKYLVDTNMQLHQTQPLIPGFIELFYIHNDGAGWGILSGQQGFLITITFVLIGYLIYESYQQRYQHWLVRLSIGLMIGGAVGNLIDRLRLGYVIDMFHFEFIPFPIFNVADIALTIGIIFAIVALIFEEHIKQEGGR